LLVTNFKEWGKGGRSVVQIFVFVTDDRTKLHATNLIVKQSGGSIFLLKNNVIYKIFKIKVLSFLVFEKKIKKKSRKSIL